MGLRIILILIMFFLLVSVVIGFSNIDDAKEEWDAKNENIKRIESLYQTCLDYRNDLYKKDKLVIDLQTQLKLLKNQIDYEKKIKETQSSLSISPLFNINAGVGFVNKDPVPFISMGVGIAFK